MPVLSIPDPAKALAEVRADPDGFGLMLVETAAIPGLAYAQVVRRCAPRLRMLFIVSDESASRAWLWEYGTVLSAPYTAAELLSVVRPLLTRLEGP